MFIVLSVDLWFIMIYDCWLCFLSTFVFFYLVLAFLFIFIFFFEFESLGSQTCESQTRWPTSTLACFTPWSPRLWYKRFSVVLQEWCFGLLDYLLSRPPYYSIPPFLVQINMILLRSSLLCGISLNTQKRGWNQQAWPQFSLGRLMSFRARINSWWTVDDQTKR